MKKTFVAALLGISLLAFTVPAADKPAADKPEKPATDKPKKSGHIPFRGSVIAMDSIEKSFTLGKEKVRTFYVTSQTKIFKNGVPAVFADLSPEIHVRGNYHETADGKLELNSLNIDTNPPASAEKPKDKEDKTAPK